MHPSRDTVVGMRRGAVPVLLATIASMSLSTLVGTAHAKRYDPDQPIPAGYHVEERGHRGLVIPGAIASGVGCLLFIGAAAQAQASSHADDWKLFAALGTLFAVPGVTLLTIGLSLPPRKVLVRDKVHFSVAPMLAKDTLGGSVGFSF